MVNPIDQMVITQDTAFSPGVYVLPGGIKLEGSHITLDGNGAVLVGVGSRETGIHLSAGKDIILKNLAIKNYRFGILAEDCQNLTISNCIVEATKEIPANTVFLDIWVDSDQVPGGGILLNHVHGAAIQHNDLSHQMNGLLSYACEDLIVLHNLANYCSGWGFHCNHTSHSIFEDNYADFCCRYEPRGPRTGHMGADSAGFLAVNGSCFNQFTKNYARLGGDGFFLAGMTPAYDLVGCDHNVFVDNDASYSPNNAFEAVFSQGNIFRGNIASHSNYGFWLGFSQGYQLENNQIISNRQAGIAVENGVKFKVQGNNFTQNRYGILLWSKHVPEFERSLPENVTSRDWTIENNKFTANFTAIRIAADQDHGIRSLPASGERGLPAPKPHHHVIRKNSFEANVTDLDQLEAVDTIFANNDVNVNRYD